MNITNTFITQSTKELRGFFFNKRGRQLFYAIHEPLIKRGSKQIAWLFCNALFEEKIFSHRVTLMLARRLAETGHLVMRFDYEGDGDSEGDFGELKDTDWQSDIEDSAQLLYRQYVVDILGIFSLRAGALVAAAAAPRVNAQKLLFWEPVVDGATYFQEGLRANLTTQLACFKKVIETREQLMDNLRRGGKINLAGHEIGAATADSLSRLRLIDLLEKAQVAVDIICLGRNRSGEFPPAWRNLVCLPKVALHNCQSPAFWGEVRMHDDAPAALMKLSLQLAHCNEPTQKAGA